jgi:hypothetical protein
MTNILPFNTKTTLDLDPDEVLENLKGKLTGFILAGRGVDGEYFYSSTLSLKSDSLWFAEKFKTAILNGEGND